MPWVSDRVLVRVGRHNTKNVEAFDHLRHGEIETCDVAPKTQSILQWHGYLGLGVD